MGNAMLTLGAIIFVAGVVLLWLIYYKDFSIFSKRDYAWSRGSILMIVLGIVLIVWGWIAHDIEASQVRGKLTAAVFNAGDREVMAGTTGAELVYFNLTADAICDVAITELTVFADGGIPQPLRAIDNLRLCVGEDVVSPVGHSKGSSFTFKLIKPLVIPAGMTRSVILTGDVSASARIGAKYKIVILAASAANSDGKTVFVAVDNQRAPLVTITAPASGS